MGLVKGDNAESSLDFTPSEPKDKAPKSTPKSAAARKPPAKPATKEELRKIEEALSEFLQLPAMAFDLRGDEWPADHVRNAGPEFAKRITKIAEIKPAFRAQLLKMIEGGMWGPLVVSGVMYALPIAVYFEVVPMPTPARLAMAGGTPTQREAREYEAQQEPGEQGSEGL